MSKGYRHKLAFASGRLPVDSIHTIHYEQYGNPTGKPVVFLHGGPGGSTSQANTVFFNPEVYRVVLFDQRGAGKSTPAACIEENTPQHLVADIEALRKHLGIEKWWMVFGGSWGSFLALLYVQTHPDVVGSLVLRGIFTGMNSNRRLSWDAELQTKYPKEYADFEKIVGSQDNPTQRIYDLLKDAKGKDRVDLARSFHTWDMITTSGVITDGDREKLEDDKWCLDNAMIDCHYYTHDFFIEKGELLRNENIHLIKHIPTSLIQGALDTCTPPEMVQNLHKSWPESELFMIPNAGHAASEPGTFEKLVEVCDKYAGL